MFDFQITLKYIHMYLFEFLMINEMLNIHQHIKLLTLIFTMKIVALKTNIGPINIYIYLIKYLI
jgi:hypothetical protein